MEQTNDAGSTPVNAPDVSKADERESADQTLDRLFDEIEAKERTAPEVEPKLDTPETEPKGAADGADAKPDDKPAPETPQGDEPAAPARFTDAAKAAFAAAPPELRREVARLERELTQGIEKYRTTSEAYEAIKDFDARAKAGGTTLKDALTNYVGLEDLIRKEPVRGMFEVCRNLQVDPAQMAQAMLEAAGGQPQSGGDAPQVAALNNKIAQLEQHIQNISQGFQQIKQDPHHRTVNEFAEKNPYFNYVANDVADELKAMEQRGEAKDLQRAYDAALARHPQLAAAQAAAMAAQNPVPPQPTTPDPAQTRKAKLAVTGTPTNGSNPTARKPAGTVEEDVDRAFSAFGM